MKMFYVSLCFFFFAIVHVQSCNYGKIRSADDIDYDFIREIVDMEEVENWAAIIKQNIIYTDKYESALPFISKEDQSTKIINVFDLLQTYVKNEEMRKTMNINVIRDIIKDCYECTSLKILSLFAFLASKDLKSIKKYHETINSDKDKDISENRDEKVDEKQDVSKDESTTHTCIDENYQGAGCNPSKFDPCNFNAEEVLLKKYSSPLYQYKYHEINDTFEVRATGKEKCWPEVPARVSYPYNILQMEKTFITMIRKQATLNITYDILLEVFKVIYGQRAADVTIDNYINGMLCVLEETLKIVDDLLKEKCVDHQGSLVKKYETLLEDDNEKEFKQYITALDHDPNTKYEPRFFTNFVFVSEKAIEETNSIALSKDLRLPKDLALLDKCFTSKITLKQKDLELLLNNSLSVPSSEDEYLGSRRSQFGAHLLLDSVLEDDIPISLGLDTLSLEDDEDYDSEYPWLFGEIGISDEDFYEEDDEDDEDEEDDIDDYYDKNEDGIENKDDKDEDGIENKDDKDKDGIEKKNDKDKDGIEKKNDKLKRKYASFIKYLNYMNSKYAVRSAQLEKKKSDDLADSEILKSNDSDIVRDVNDKTVLNIGTEENKTSGDLVLESDDSHIAYSETQTENKL